MLLAILILTILNFIFLIVVIGKLTTINRNQLVIQENVRANLQQIYNKVK